MPYGPFTYLTDIIAQSGGLPNAEILKTITQQEIDGWDGAAAAIPIIQSSITGINAEIVGLHETDTSLQAQIDAGGGGGEALPVPAIYDMKAYQLESGTSLSGSITVQAGCIVIAAVVYRSEPTSHPTGWTLLGSSPNIGDADTAYQQAFLYYKKSVSAGTESIVATQPSTGRIYINLLCFNTTDTPSFVNALSISGADAATNSGLSVIDYVKPSNNVAVVVAHTMYWPTVSAPIPVYNVQPTLYKRIELGNTTQSRLACFVDDERAVARRITSASSKKIGLCACYITGLPAPGGGSVSTLINTGKVLTQNQSSDWKDDISTNSISVKPVSSVTAEIL